MAKSDQTPLEETPQDPVARSLGSHSTQSLVAIYGHPVHAMLVAFPIALAFCTLLSDLAYWWTGDAFWLRTGLWSIGGAFVSGLIAAMAGIAELLMVSGIRKRSAPWTHFLIAMTLLAIHGLNWGMRLRFGSDVVLPMGLAASALGWIFTVFTGWHGGKLVFDYRLGTSEENGN